MYINEIELKLDHQFQYKMPCLTKFQNKLSKISYIEKSFNARWKNEDTIM